MSVESALRRLLASLLALLVAAVVVPRPAGAQEEFQAQGAGSAAGGSTRPISVNRGGRTFQRTTVEVDTAPDGRLTRAGSLLVRFKSGADQNARRGAHQRAGAAKAERTRLPEIVRVHLPPGGGRAAVARALAEYRKDPEVESAEPELVVRRTGTPNDPRFAEQWGMAKVSAPSAWDMTHGASVKVAVLDCGIYSRSSTFEGPAD